MYYYILLLINSIFAIYILKNYKKIYNNYFKPKLNIILLENKFDSNCLPETAFKDNAGLDIKSYYPHIIKAGETAVIETKISIEIPEPTLIMKLMNKRYFGKICGRSSLLKKSILVDGVVDENYTGELFIILTNNSQNEFRINSGNKIAQLIIQDYMPSYDYKIIKKSNKTTTRGEKNFGSSGI